MFIQLATDFACELDQVFSFTRTSDDMVRVVFKDNTKQDLKIGVRYDVFMTVLENLGELNYVVRNVEINENEKVTDFLKDKNIYDAARKNT